MRHTLYMHGVEIWSQINESARIVAWPCVVVLGLLVFKTKLGGVVQRLREADTPVGSMKFDPSNQLTANRSIAVAGSALVETLRAEIADTADVKAEGQSPALEDIEGDVEAVIKASFAAGFDLARAFHSKDLHIDEGRSPAPVIEWEAGTPLVTGYELYVPDYAALRKNFESLRERLDEILVTIPDLGGAISALEEMLEEARQDGDVDEEARVQRFLDESRAMRDALMSGLPTMRENYAKLSQARVIVPLNRRPMR